MSFSKKAYTKCIITGEHSVMRGYDALVVPCFSFFTHLSYEENDSYLVVFEKKPTTQEENSLLTGLVHNLYHSLTGAIDISKSLFQGTGLVGSAGLSFLLANLLRHKNLITEEEIFQTALSFEKEFHGGSTSGVDVACVYYEKPILFNKEKAPIFLKHASQFAFYLYALPVSSNSKTDIACVQEYIKNNQHEGTLLDELMHQSTHHALKAYETNDLDLMKRAITESAECFEKWGLLTKEAYEAIEHLKYLGALAVKPTGSGGGGFLLTLWPDDETAINASKKMPQALVGLGKKEEQ